MSYIKNNLLSIDLDIIFKDSINLYNSYINDAPKKRIWDEIQKENFEINYNYDIYNILYNFISSLPLERIKKIFLGENHSSIILASDYIYKINPKKINLINIDHHHDIFYNSIQEEDIVKYNCCGPANWVSFLYKEGIINKDYYWIKNDNSEFFNLENLYFFDKKNFLKIHYIDSSKLNIFFQNYRKEIEYLYITSSDKWCPPQFREKIDNIFNLLLLKAKEKVINYNYNISHPDNAPINYFNRS